MVGFLRRLVSSARGDKPPTALAPPTEGEASGTKPKDVIAMLTDMRERIDVWIAEARQATGRDVVVMFSMEHMYDPANLNRPAQLAGSLLEDGCPVFFNFDQCGVDELPSHREPALIQSHTEITSRILPQLLEADFGEKTKLLVIGFPHELMVRYISYAEQHGWRVAYDAYQDSEESARLNANMPYQLEYEWYISKNAHTVSAVSGALAQKLETISGRKVGVIPNAPSRGLLLRPPANETPPFVVGFFAGESEDLTDWELLLRCARRYPNVLFELVGVGTAIDPEVANVRLLGRLSSDERSGVISRWGAAIIPFIFSPASESVDPVGLYDIVASGLSVVTTYLPQVRGHPGVNVAESPEEFVELVGSLIEQGNTRREPGLGVAGYQQLDQPERNAPKHARLCPASAANPGIPHQHCSMKPKLLFAYRFGVLGGVATQLLNRYTQFAGRFDVRILFEHDHGVAGRFPAGTAIAIGNSAGRVAHMQDYAADITVIIDAPNMITDWHRAGRVGQAILEVHTTTSNFSYLDKLTVESGIKGIITVSEYMARMVTATPLGGGVPVRVVSNCLTDGWFGPWLPPSATRSIPLVWVGKLDGHKRVLSALTLWDGSR